MHAEIIQTTREIANPTPDGRNKHDWNKAKTIPAGKRPVEAKEVAEIKAVTDCDVDSDVILQTMLKLGRITVKDFRDVTRELEAQYAAEEQQ